MSIKIKTSWWKDKGSNYYQLSTPHISFFGNNYSGGYCLSVNLMFVEFNFWIGSKDNLKDI